MPITMRIDKKLKIVHTTVEGQVSVDEIIDKLTDFMEQPDFVSGLNGIADLRNFELNTTPLDIERLAKLLIDYRDKIGPSKAAVVISRQVTFGLTRMFQAFAEQSSIETAIFEDMDEALRWLGIEEK